MSNPSWIPTRKWIATQITALTALILAWAGAGAWDKTLTIALIGLISQAFISYLIPNPQPAGSSPSGAGSALPEPAGTPAG